MVNKNNHRHLRHPPASVWSEQQGRIQGFSQAGQGGCPSSQHERDSDMHVVRESARLMFSEVK